MQENRKIATNYLSRGLIGPILSAIAIWSADCQPIGRKSALCPLDWPTAPTTFPSQPPVVHFPIPKLLCSPDFMAAQMSCYYLAGRRTNQTIWPKEGGLLGVSPFPPPNMSRFRSCPSHFTCAAHGPSFGCVRGDN